MLLVYRLVYRLNVRAAKGTFFRMPDEEDSFTQHH